MSGVINNLGAVSGILGTTVGTGGSTSASDLDSGTLAIARMAVNTVVQVKYYVSEVHATGTNNTHVEAVSGTITTSNATNKILVISHVQANFHVATAASFIGCGLILDATWSGGSSQKLFGPRDGSGFYGNRINTFTTNLSQIAHFLPCQHLFEPDYEGVVTIKASAAGYSGHTTNVNVQDAIDGQSSLVLMEVVAT